ncbi:MAG TPA: gamma carbonic anhydrase family protein, partial [Paenibacillus sp.]
MLIPYGNKVPQIHGSVYVAEGVKIIGDVEIGEDSSVWFNSVLRGDMAPI